MVLKFANYSAVLTITKIKFVMDNPTLEKKCIVKVSLSKIHFSLLEKNIHQVNNLVAIV